MEKKKKNTGLIVLIVIFILIILGLTGYILMDKGVIPNFLQSNEEKETVEENEEKEEKEAVEEIDINNENIKKLFYIAHDHWFIAEPGDKFIYGNEKITVEQMETNYKFQLAANIFSDKISQNMTENGYVQEIDEESVKSAYEQVFGPNTYRQVFAFNLFCGDYSYNSVTKKYVNTESGCGGTTRFTSQENIIKVLKYQDRIEITSAVVFDDGDALYKDINKKNKIMDAGGNINLASYVNQNKDNLAQITYTFELGEDGFYYYKGFEHTKE